MENRNLLLAVVLSLAVLIAWQYFFIQPRVEAERQAQLEQAAQQEAVEALDPATGAVSTTPQPRAGTDDALRPTPGGTTLPAAGATREATVGASPRIRIETPRLEGSINLTGARIDDLRLKDYHETVDPTSPTIVLLSPSGTDGAFFADTGWVAEAGSDVSLPTTQTVWQAEEGAVLSPDSPVTLTWDNGEGLVFTRTISVDRNYMFTVEQSVRNGTDESLRLYPYSLVQRQGTPATSGFFILHEGMIGVIGEEGLVQPSYGNLEDDGVITPGTASSGWLGITDKYWAATVIPTPGSTFEPRFLYQERRGVPIYQADFLGAAVEVPAGGSGEAVNRVFAGAKEVDVIAGYEDALGIDRFNLLIDWGWFYFLTKPLFYALDFFYKLVGNFGVSILIVTLLIKLVFFPLANKAYTSMSKMKKLQPEMVKLRERYKDDRMKQQQALMELYKKEQINPLAGCIPILIQIPVFFALYKVLFVSIEMRHAPFFGWIQDLSARDPTSIFNLFGLLPYDPGAVPILGPWLILGVWPILMGITMWVQMKMNPAPPDPTQAMIFNWMPVLFTFLLASFPAGLVIYWAWNNFLSVLQQGVIMRRQGVKIELWDNISGIFRKKASKGST